jgi:hypothetical protein
VGGLLNIKNRVMCCCSPGRSRYQQPIEYDVAPVGSQRHLGCRRRHVIDNLGEDLSVRKAAPTAVLAVARLWV